MTEPRRVFLFSGQLIDAKGWKEAALPAGAGADLERGAALELRLPFR